MSIFSVVHPQDWTDIAWTLFVVGSFIIGLAFA